MFKKFLKKKKTEKGFSSTIEFLIFIVFIVGLLSTSIDTGFYFSNRAVISTMVQDSARLGAVYGGTHETPISRKYGISSITPRCMSESILSDKSDIVACNLLEKLLDSKGLVQTELTSVDCGPDKTDFIGERTFCEVRYKYKGLPMSGLSMLDFSNFENAIRKVTESEVVLS